MEKYYNGILSIGIHSRTANCGQTFEGKTMIKKRQILLLQIRILQMTSESFKLSLADTARLFKEYDVLLYIRQLFYVFCFEGDKAIMADIKKYLKKKGATI